MIRNGELRLLEFYMPKSKIVFDVGANVGYWTNLAKKINHNLEIHSFEPSKHIFMILSERVKDKGLILNNFGLSSEKGEKLLYKYSGDSGLSSLYQRKGVVDGLEIFDKTTEELIIINTLDNYCAEMDINSIDYVKIDVEGHELEVLKGGESLIERGIIKYIQFEYGGCNIDARILLQDIFMFLQTYHYELFKVFPKELKHYSRYDQRLENFQYQNWIAISPIVDMECL